MKKLVLFLSVCALLASAVWVGAAGDAGDPLASLSYLNGEFSQRAEKKIDQALEQSDKELAERLKNGEVGEAAATWQETRLKEGDTLHGVTGTGVLLLAVYMGLAYLGATVSAQYTNDIGRAQLIMVIIEALMGKVGMVLFGVVVGLACVTTAVALTSSAAAYFTELCRGKVSYKVFVIAICVFSAVVSNLGLDRIVAVAAPVLDVIYPPTLVLIFISLLMPRIPDRVSRGAVIGALITSVLCTLTAHGVRIPFVASLPLYDLGLSWLIPAAVFGLAASLLRGHARKAEKVFSKPNEEL